RVVACSRRSNRTGRSIRWLERCSAYGVGNLRSIKGCQPLGSAVLIGRRHTVGYEQEIVGLAPVLRRILVAFVARLGVRCRQEIELVVGMKDVNVSAGRRVDLVRIIAGSCEIPHGVVEALGKRGPGCGRDVVDLLYEPGRVVRFAELAGRGKARAIRIDVAGGSCRYRALA